MGIVIENIERQIVVPTDIRAFITDARRDLSGTEYPGALQLGQALQRILIAEDFTPREIRFLMARYVIALEDYDDVALEALDSIMGVLALIDFKNYWNRGE